MPKKAKETPAKVLKSHKAERAREVRLGIVAIKHNGIMTKVAQNIQNGKKSTIATVNEESGYSPEYRHMKDTDTWQALMEKHIPDSLLAKVHKEGLAATRGSKNPTPDYTARHKYLDSGYKLKKRYDNTLKLTHEYAGVDDEALRAELAGVISEVSQGLANLKGAQKKGGATSGKKLRP